MKHLFRIFFLTFVGLVIGTGPLWAAPEVAVTIKPVHSLVAGVMEGVGSPHLLMDGMVSPHTYQMRPSAARMLVRADLVIWVGEGVEATFPETVGMLPRSVRTVELMEAEGLGLLPLRDGGVRSEDHESHAHGQFDPHIWLDPQNAIALTNLFVEELSSLDPVHASAYRTNGAAQVLRLRTLEDELRVSLSPVSATPFLTFHDAYQYFETAFGLRRVASIALSPERSPGARMIVDLRREIRDKQVRCIFAEPQFEPSLVATLIEGTQAQAGTLDPLGRDVPAGPGAYEAIMRGLARDAITCLAPPFQED